MNLLDIDWTSIGSSGLYQYARVEITGDGGCFSGCCDRPMVLTSERPFGATLWEISQDISYAASGGIGYQLKTP